MVSDNRKKLDARDLCEAVLRRSEMLEPDDRVLVQQVLGRGVKPREIAALGEESTRVVQRRVRGLVMRLSDERVLWVMRQHYRWEEPMRSVGLGVWVKGWTLREASERLSVSLYRVRESVTRVKGMMSQARRGGERRVWREEKDFTVGALRRAGEMLYGEGGFDEDEVGRGDHGDGGELGALSEMHELSGVSGAGGDGGRGEGVADG